MLCIVTLFTLWTLPCISGQANIPQRVPVRVGLEAEIRCSTTDTASIIYWYGPNNVVLFVGSTRITRDDRINLVKPYANAWNLRITNVKVSDAGLYKCSPFKPTSGIMAKVFTLEVYSRPRIIPSKSSGNRIVQERDNVTLNCFASGFPEPKIMWHKEGENKKYLSTGQQLSFSGINRDDSGAYKCTAHNGEGMSDTKTILVDVQYAPTISTKVQVKELDVQLECMVEWNPQDELIWTKDGEDLNQNWKYKTSIINQTSTLSTMILVINQIEGPSDFGLYSCIAKNKFGEAIGNITMPMSNETSPGKGKNSGKGSDVCKLFTDVLVTIFMSLFGYK